MCCDVLWCCVVYVVSCDVLCFGVLCDEILSSHVMLCVILCRVVGLFFVDYYVMLANIVRVVSHG